MDTNNLTNKRKNDNTEYIDLLEWAEIISANRRPIGIVTLAFVAAAILYLLIASPVYESKALLQVKQEQGLGSSLLETAAVGNVMMNQQKMNTYAEILKSAEVVVPVIEATEEAKDGVYPDYEQYVERRITTSPFKDTAIMQLRVTGKSPELAQKTNELLLDSFQKRISVLSHAEQTATKDFLDDRTKKAKEELQKAEEALQQYKAENNIASPSDNARVFTERMAEIKKRADVNQIDMEAAQARLNAINSQLGSSGAASADNRTIQQYNAELAQLEAERISYLDKFTEKNPKLVDVNDRIARLKAKIEEEIYKIASLQSPSDNAVHQGLVAGKYQSESELAVARQKAAALQQVIDQNNADMAKLSTVEQGYVQVARDAKVADEIYVMLAKRFEEAKVAEVMQPTGIQVVSNPTLSKRPVSPRKGRTLLGALLAGFFLGSLLTIARELLNRVIRTEEDFKKYTGLPVLGAIPDMASMEKAMEEHKEDEEPGLFSRIEGYIWKK